MKKIIPIMSIAFTLVACGANDNPNVIATTSAPPKAAAPATPPAASPQDEKKAVNATIKSLEEQLTKLVDPDARKAAEAALKIEKERLAALDAKIAAHGQTNAQLSQDVLKQQEEKRREEEAKAKLDAELQARKAQLDRMKGIDSPPSPVAQPASEPAKKPVQPAPAKQPVVVATPVKPVAKPGAQPAQATTKKATAPAKKPTAAKVELKSPEIPVTTPLEEEKKHGFLKHLHKSPFVYCRAKFVEDQNFFAIFGINDGEWVITCRQGFDGEDFTVLAKKKGVEVGIGWKMMRAEGETVLVGIGLNRKNKGYGAQIGVKGALAHHGKGGMIAAGLQAQAISFGVYGSYADAVQGHGAAATVELNVWYPSCGEGGAQTEVSDKLKALGYNAADVQKLCKQ